MKTREELLAIGLSVSDIQRFEMAQHVYDCALQLVRKQVPNAPDYLVRSMTLDLLLRAAGR